MPWLMGSTGPSPRTPRRPPGNPSSSGEPLFCLFQPVLHPRTFPRVPAAAARLGATNWHDGIVINATRSLSRSDANTREHEYLTDVKRTGGPTGMERTISEERNVR